MLSGCYAKDKFIICLIRSNGHLVFQCFKLVHTGCFRPPWKQKWNKINSVPTVTPYFRPNRNQNYYFLLCKLPQKGTFLGVRVHFDNFECQNMAYNFKILHLYRVLWNVNIVNPIGGKKTFCWRLIIMTYWF